MSQRGWPKYPQMYWCTGKNRPFLCTEEREDLNKGESIYDNGDNGKLKEEDMG